MRYTYIIYLYIYISHRLLQDILDPSQIHPHTGRPSIRNGRVSIREEDDDNNLLGEDPVSPGSLKKTDNEETVKQSDLAAAGINGERAMESALGQARRGQRRSKSLQADSHPVTHPVRPVKIMIFTCAFLFVIFVLMASSTSLGVISEALYGDQLQAMRVSWLKGMGDLWKSRV